MNKKTILKGCAALALGLMLATGAMAQEAAEFTVIDRKKKTENLCGQCIHRGFTIHVYFFCIPYAAMLSSAFCVSSSACRGVSVPLNAARR